MSARSWSINMKQNRYTTTTGISKCWLRLRYGIMSVSPFVPLCSPLRLPHHKEIFSHNKKSLPVHIFFLIRKQLIILFMNKYISIISLIKVNSKVYIRCVVRENERECANMVYICLYEKKSFWPSARVQKADSNNLLGIPWLWENHRKSKRRASVLQYRKDNHAPNIIGTQFNMHWNLVR